MRQRSCHCPASVLAHAAAVLSARSSRDATRADTSRSDFVCRVNALAGTSNEGESLRLEHPLGNADETRAVCPNEKYRGCELLLAENSAFNFRSMSFGRLFQFEIHIGWNKLRESKSAPSNGASFIVENRVSDRLKADQHLTAENMWTSQN